MLIKTETVSAIIMKTAMLVSSGETEMANADGVPWDRITAMDKWDGDTAKVIKGTLLTQIRMAYAIIMRQLQIKGS